MLSADLDAAERERGRALLPQVLSGISRPYETGCAYGFGRLRQRRLNVAEEACQSHDTGLSQVVGGTATNLLRQGAVEETPQRIWHQDRTVLK